MVSDVYFSRQADFDTVGLRTAAVELEVVPALGGRVVRLLSRRSGREWCWHRDGERWLWKSDSPQFDDSPQAGFDECLPTVAACSWRGKQLADHGELWSREWPIESQALAQSKLRSTLELRALPLTFTREIHASAGGAVTFDYSLSNLGSAPEAYVWSAHPLLVIAPGDRLMIPREIKALRLNGGVARGAHGDTEFARGTEWPYPEPLPGVRLDRLQTAGAQVGCVKAFAGPLAGRPRAAIWNDRTGDRLEVRWDAAVNPYLGLWLNRGYGGFHHVALEPTNAAADSLADAAEEAPATLTLAPGETRVWSVEWHVS